ncbi:MAG: hypothetical protein QOD73_476 [Solirubrobacteraceae bacterium]|jgi:hypothetical protein|nr:hypothetical protein [Solirubrobacteraceae bacterium]
MRTSTSLSGALADDRERALRKKARTAWQRHPHGELKLRAATDADTSALLRLARLDSSRALKGTIILAEDNGEIVAAITVEDGTSIANPFRATAPIVAMLRVHASQPREPRPHGRAAFLRRLTPSARAS